MSAPIPERSEFDPPAPNGLLLGGLAASAVLLIGALIAPSAAAWGWLVGFVFWSSFPIGAIALSLIHETTGGRWGLAAAPTLWLSGLSALALLVFFAVLLIGLHALYPWANHGAGAAPNVARFYLNVPAFAARGFVAIVIWAAIGLLIATGRLGLLGASIALVFHGVAVSLTAIDWMLSIDPQFSDSAFGAEMAVQQIMLTLAAVAVFQPRRAVEIADGDIGGLLLATALGAFYLGLMTFIVKWYGDQPVDAAWYLARSHGLWLALLIGAILLGAVVPIVGCAWEHVRASPTAMRAVGVSAIVGIFLHDLWLAGSAAPDLAGPAALLAAIAMAGILAWDRAPHRLAAASPLRRVCQKRGAVMIAERAQERDQPTVRGGAVAAVMGSLAFIVLVVVGLSAANSRDRARQKRKSAMDDAERTEEREQPAVRAGVVAAVMGGFFVFVVLVAVGLFFFYQSLANDATFVAVNRFPEPRLQTKPDGLRDPEIARQQAELERFRWIDKPHGVFQIPIGEAMKMVAARGAKAYDPVPGPPPLSTAATP